MSSSNQPNVTLPKKRGRSRKMDSNPVIESTYATKELAFNAANLKKITRCRKGINSTTPTFTCRIEACNYTVAIKKVGFEFGIAATDKIHEHVDISTLGPNEFIKTRKLDMDDFALQKAIEFKKAGLVTNTINHLLQNDPSVRCNLDSKQLKNKMRAVLQKFDSKVKPSTITTLDLMKYADEKRDTKDINNEDLKDCLVSHINTNYVEQDVFEDYSSLSDEEVQLIPPLTIKIPSSIPMSNLLEGANVSVNEKTLTRCQARCYGYLFDNSGTVQKPFYAVLFSSRVLIELGKGILRFIGMELSN
uniref:FLYWCH-type domain-containing protein n=1 Tax=Rhabditophanes sp. KR3021 TaxID=114890 RepID=A0AC35TIK3_9BILA